MNTGVFSNRNIDSGAQTGTGHCWAGFDGRVGLRLTRFRLTGQETLTLRSEGLI